MAPLVSGIIPAVITPFDSSGNLDTAALGRYVSKLASKVDGLFIAGSYGSGPLMSESERCVVAEAARRAVNDDTPVIVHVGAPDTDTTVRLAQHSESIGATAVAAVTPYYYRHSEDEIFDYYARLIDSVRVPVIAYNNPKYSNFSISATLLGRLRGAGLAGVKDSSGDIQLFYAYIAEIASAEFTFLIGSQTLLLPALVMGGHGCVSGLSNAFPELIQSIFRAWVNGDPRGAAEAQGRANELRRLTGEGIPVPFYHAVLPMLGLDIGFPRPPLRPLSPERRDEIGGELVRLGMIDRVGLS